jgi:hypothetical protein
MVCVAALSFAACTDVDSVGGGEGITSSKIPTKAPDLAPTAEVAGLGSILNQMPARDVCEGCVMTSYATIDTRYFDEVRIVKDENFDPVCTIYVKDGFVITDECGVFH